jgi:hypothetical protein
MPSISTRNVLGRTALRSILTGVLALLLVFGAAATADAKQKRKKPQYISQSRSQYYSPSDVAERQRKASTFDETQYYEVDSRKLPFGSAAWWRQMQQESDSGLP